MILRKMKAAAVVELSFSLFFFLSFFSPKEVNVLSLNYFQVFSLFKLVFWMA